jgi:two-component system, chemotaxis family, chemotaxis protein CheY
MAKILIIDDSATIRSKVREALLATGHEILEAGDGVEGLERLRAGDVALALCDINMPRLNGLEVLAELQKSGSPTRVVMLTTELSPSMMQRARACGAKGWIVKPFRTDLLRTAINKVLESAG